MLIADQGLAELSWQEEHRYRAVLELRDGASASEVARRYGTSRQSIYNWKARFDRDGLRGLREQSRRPHHSPRRMPAEVEALVCQLRRAHPRWGARRLVFELAAREVVASVPAPSTVHRALGRPAIG